MSANAIATALSGPGDFTPSRLIRVFCRPELRSGFRASKRDEAERCDWHAGFCSYCGPSSYATGVDGFDDGTNAWGELTRSGWTLIENPASSQFPYSFQMQWRPAEREQLEAALAQAGGRGVDTAERLDELRQSPDGRWCILHYCEGDFGVAVYDDEDAYKAGERKGPRGLNPATLAPDFSPKPRRARRIQSRAALCGPLPPKPKETHHARTTCG